MNSIYKFQTPFDRKVAFWGLVAVLALLVMDATKPLPAVGEVGGNSSAVRPSIASGPNPQSFGEVYPERSRKAQDRSPSPNTQAPTQARTITYTYDDAGRLIGADYGEGAQLIYSYDAAGNLKHVADHYRLFLPVVVR